MDQSNAHTHLISGHNDRRVTFLHGSYLEVGKGQYRGADLLHRRYAGAYRNPVAIKPLESAWLLLLIALGFQLHLWVWVYAGAAVNFSTAVSYIFANLVIPTMLKIFLKCSEIPAMTTN